MAVHRRNPKNYGGQLCVRTMGKVSAQNYEVAEEEEFKELLRVQPEICCKRCAAKPFKQ